jgi:hypothetical protein
MSEELTLGNINCRLQHVVFDMQFLKRGRDQGEKSLPRADNSLRMWRLETQLRECCEDYREKNMFLKKTWMEKENAFLDIGLCLLPCLELSSSVCKIFRVCPELW